MATLGEANVAGRLTPAWLLDAPAKVLEAMALWNHRNLLINSRWNNKAYIINQQGADVYAGSVYGIDRWKSNSAACLLTVGDGYIKMSNNTASTSTATQYLYQVVENESSLVGQTVTLSFIAKGNINIGARSDAGVVAQSGYVEYSDYTLVKISMTISSITGDLVFFIQTPNKGEFFAKAAKLELGTEQTLAHQDAGGNWVLNDPPPDPAVELLKCQRNLVVLNSGSSVYNVGFHGIITNNGADIIAYVPLTIPLRTTPSVSLSEVKLIVRTHAGYESYASYTAPGTPTSATTYYQAGNNSCSIKFNFSQASSLNNVPCEIGMIAGGKIILNSSP